MAEHNSQLDKSPYAYAWNSPVVYDDPSGMCPECEEKVKDPTTGQVYNSTGGETYVYDGSNWTRQGGMLAAVTVGRALTPTPISSGARNYGGDGSGNAHD